MRMGASGTGGHSLGVQDRHKQRVPEFGCLPQPHTHTQDTLVVKVPWSLERGGSRGLVGEDRAMPLARSWGSHCPLMDHSVGTLAVP